MYCSDFDPTAPVISSSTFHSGWGFSLKSLTIFSRAALPMLEPPSESLRDGDVVAFSLTRGASAVRSAGASGVLLFCVGHGRGGRVKNRGAGGLGEIIPRHERPQVFRRFLGLCHIPSGGQFLAQPMECDVLCFQRRVANQ